MHFTPSHASRLVQAADLVAYLYHRIERVTIADKRSLAATDRLWRILQPRIVHQQCWYPTAADSTKAPLARGPGWIGKP